MSLLPLPTVKPHLRIEQTVDDVILQDKLDAAEAYVANDVGGADALGSSTVTETVRGCGAFVLTKTPVAALTSVTADVYGSYPTANLRWNPDSGVVRAKAYTLPLREDYYTVVYTTGYASASAVPDDLVEAVRLMTQHFYETQRGARKPNVGGDLLPDSAFARARQILDNRRTPGNA